MYLRFVTGTIDPWSGKRRGIFQAAADLRDSTETSPLDHQRLRTLFDWFNANLKRPDRLAASRRPRAKAQAISWFKDTAHDHIARIREMTLILLDHGVGIEVIRTDRPGYVVYEDDHQVAALPFADTPT